MMFSSAFWKATIQRVVRSFAASLSALLVADGTGVLNANWTDQLSAAGMAGIVTLLLCLAGETATNGNGPAFGQVEVTSPPAPKNQAGYVESWVGIAILVVVVIVAAVILF